MTRLLIVRLGALGDVVHAIPVAAAVRRAFPTARIDWLVSAKHREVLDLVPVIDRRLVIHDRAGSQGGSSMLAAIRELGRARYDVVLDLQGLLKSAVLARAARAARVIGFAAPYLRERLARLFYTEVYDPGRGGLYHPNETRHVVEINLGLLRPLGLTALVPEFPIERVESEVARVVAQEVGGRYVLINPGAAWLNKQWPPDRFGAVAAALRDRHGIQSVVTWGPGEEGIAHKVLAHANGAALVPPATSIADLVALVRGARLVISGDTGPIHLATAVGTPVVGMFGPTRSCRNGPWSPADVVVSRAEVCQCHHLRRCTRARPCLMDIDVEEVLGAAKRRLAAPSSTCV